MSLWYIKKRNTSNIEEIRRKRYNTTCILVNKGVNMENRNILLLTTLSCLFLGFIVPLVVWLAIKEQFTDGEKAYLTNLLNFELTLLIWWVIFSAINIVPLLGQIIFMAGSGLLWIMNIIIIIIATLKVAKNEEYKIPFAFELIK